MYKCLIRNKVALHNMTNSNTDILNTYLVNNPKVDTVWNLQCNACSERVKWEALFRQNTHGDLPGLGIELRLPIQWLHIFSLYHGSHLHILNNYTFFIICMKYRLQTKLFQLFIALRPVERFVFQWYIRFFSELSFSYFSQTASDTSCLNNLQKLQILWLELLLFLDKVIL